LDELVLSNQSRLKFQNQQHYTQPFYKKKGREEEKNNIFRLVLSFCCLNVENGHRILYYHKRNIPNARSVANDVILRQLIALDNTVG
jgi:hypothetical protein